MIDEKWLSILISQKGLDDSYESTRLHGKFPIFLVEGINQDTANEESLVVFDCSSLMDKERFPYEVICNICDKNSASSLVLIFKNWEQSRSIFWEHNDSLKTANEKYKFSNWFNSKLFIYLDSDHDITLHTDDDGINYVNYDGFEFGENTLHGHIYNLSFYELKKLFNVTGLHLFVNNVRYGLNRNRTGEQLQSNFNEYLKVSIFLKALRESWDPCLMESLREAFGISDEEVSKLEQLKTATASADVAAEFLLPKNFWFYHNGISIFSYEQELRTPADKIILNPNKVSVINGAQTMTNFFLAAESVERILMQVLQDVKETSLSLCAIMESVLKEIIVKVIIIHGTESFVRPITRGLNTQIPVLEEALLADSKYSEEINRILDQFTSASCSVKIVKDGETFDRGYGLSVLEFVKCWLTICNQPGKSKNFSKNELESTLNNITRKLGDMPDFPNKIALIFQIEQWWKSARPQRLQRDENASDYIAIGKYGKNYFQCYTIHKLMSPVEEGSYENISLDNEELSVLYEKFLKDIISANSGGDPIALETFKNDSLSGKLLQLIQEKATNEQPTSSIVQGDASQTTFDDQIADMERCLVKTLNNENCNSYTVYRTIADYLIQHDILIDNFRVVKRTDGKCNEAFPFSNSTFNELSKLFDPRLQTSEMLVNKASTVSLKFSESLFAQKIKTPFPVFVIDYIQTEDNSLPKLVDRVRFIKDFSFAAFIDDAKKVFDKTIQAFELGDENMFPRSGQGLHFHIRPKAANADDTFCFSNGSYITKRTFWANKDTIEELIENSLEKDK